MTEDVTSDSRDVNVSLAEYKEHNPTISDYCRNKATTHRLPVKQFMEHADYLELLVPFGIERQLLVPNGESNLHGLMVFGDVVTAWASEESQIPAAKARIVGLTGGGRAQDANL